MILYSLNVLYRQYYEDLFGSCWHKTRKGFKGHYCWHRGDGECKQSRYENNNQLVELRFFQNAIKNGKNIRFQNDQL